MLIILGVVASVKRKGAFTERPVQVSDLTTTRRFGKNYHVGFDERFHKVGCLSNKTLDSGDVILSQHGRHLVILCAELEQREIVYRRISQLWRRRALIDIRMLILAGIENGPKVRKSEGLSEIQLIYGVWVNGIAVVFCRHDVCSVSS